MTETREIEFIDQRIGTQSQDVVVTDLISEGEIEGLAQAEASIFLNDDRLIPGNNFGRRTPSGPVRFEGTDDTKVTLTSGSSNVSMSNIPDDTLAVIVGENKTTFLVANGAHGSAANITIYPCNPDSGEHTITTSSSFFTTDMISPINPANNGDGVKPELISPIEINYKLTGTEGETERYVGRILSVESSTRATWVAGLYDAPATDLGKKDGFTYNIRADAVLKITSNGRAGAGTGLESGKVTRYIDKSYNTTEQDVKDGRLLSGYVRYMGDNAGSPYAKANVTSIAIPTEVDGDEYYSIKWIGYFKPATSGYYQFKSHSDDGNGMWIGQPALEAAVATSTSLSLQSHLILGGLRNGLGSYGEQAEEESVPIDLKAGVYYPFVVIYTQGSRDDFFTWKWRKTGDNSTGPDTAYTTFGGTQFFAPASYKLNELTYFQLESNWSGTTQQCNFRFFERPNPSKSDLELDNVVGAKYRSVGVGFKPGTRTQSRLNWGGPVTDAISKRPTLAVALTQSTYSSQSGSVAPSVIQGLSSDGFNLSSAQMREIDGVRINISYPNGLYGRGTDNELKVQFARYHVKIALKTESSANFGNELLITDELVHAGSGIDGVSFQMTIPLKQFRPFTDFKVIIGRITPHSGSAIGTSSDEVGDSDNGMINASSAITGVTAYFTEHLTYPYTAYARIGFNSKDFGKLPKRTYECLGMKVLVPSNYITELESGNGIPEYRRNVTTGDTNSTLYVPWDGNFRDQKVYTANPAWIYYDILLNDRYGLGDFLEQQDIDKFALYRIARYCDEMVPDGNGGTEPRFRANLYLTKASDAYKVLKDMATIFRGLIYLIDGQVHPVIDQAKDPVYNFSKANVIDGNFSYQTAGDKTRTNQFLVTWINPDNNWQREVLIVEDRDNIIETGRVIRRQAEAFGCTSQGQATRFGRWKLWTALNNTEVVSFSTGINASFLRPGDIINIQDSARHGTRWSGRLKSGSTKTTLLLDSGITIRDDNAYTYTVSTVHVQPGAFLAQDSATIAGVTYSRGDFIEKAFIPDSSGNYPSSSQSLTLEEHSYNAKETQNSTVPLNLSWSEHTRVEQQPLNKSGISFSGSPAVATLTSITVSSDFVNNPEAETVWIVSENYSGSAPTTATKPYNIIAISEDSKNNFLIRAVEHYNEKFSTIEENFSTATDDGLYRPPRATDIVPPPTNLSHQIIRGTNVALRLSWTRPVYTNTKSFTLTAAENGMIFRDDEAIHASVSSLDLKIDPIVGKYSISLRTNSTESNNRSETVYYNFILTADQLPQPTIDTPTANLIPINGKSDAELVINSDLNRIEFDRTSWEVRTTNDKVEPISNTTFTTTNWSQDISGLPTISTPTFSSDFEQSVHYLVLDQSSSTDKLKLIKFDTSHPNISFWFDAIDGGTTISAGSSQAWGGVDTYSNGQNGNGTRNSGTIVVTKGSTTVKGDANNIFNSSYGGSAFLTELQPGDIIKRAWQPHGSSGDLFTNYVVGKVAKINSNDSLELESPALVVTSGFSFYQRIKYRPDTKKDLIIAAVWKESTGYKFKSFLTAQDQEAPTPPKDLGLRHYWPLTGDGEKISLLDAALTGSPAIIGGGRKAGDLVTITMDNYYALGDTRPNPVSNSGIGSGAVPDYGIDTKDSITGTGSYFTNRENALKLIGDYYMDLNTTDTSGPGVNGAWAAFIWFKSTTGQSTGHLNADIMSRDAANFWEIQLDQNSTPQGPNSNLQDLKFFSGGGSSSASSLAFTLSDEVVLQKWHHVGMSYDGTTLKYYLDGKVRNSSTTAYQPQSASASLTVGGLNHDGGTPASFATAVQESTTHNFTGKLEEFRLYNHAPSDAEVRNLYKNAALIQPAKQLDPVAISSAGKQTVGTGNNSFTTDGEDATYRAWAGDQDAATAPYAVKKEGNLELKSSQSHSLNLTHASSTLSLSDDAITADKVGGGTLDTSDVTIPSGKALTVSAGTLSVTNGTLNLGSSATTIVGGATRTDGKIDGDGVRGGRITFDNGVANQGIRGINTDATIDYMNLDVTSGYTLDVKSGGTFEISSGSTVKIGTGTDTTGLIPVGALKNDSHAIDISGTAADATILETTRYIAGQAFNGSQNVAVDLGDLANVTEFNKADGKVLKWSASNSRWEPAADLVGSGSGGIQLSDLSVGAEASAAGDGGLAYNNSSGIFTYTPPLNITGNAATATTLETARNFTVGSTNHTFNGAANVDLTEAVRDLVAGFIVGGTNVTATHDDSGNTLTLAASGSGGSGIALTDLSATGGTNATGGALSYNNSSGVFTFTPVTDITGNAATATALATGRDIALTGLITGTASGFDGTANASITTAIANDAISGDKIHGGNISDATITNSPLINTSSDGTSANWKAAYDAVFASHTAFSNGSCFAYTGSVYGTGTSPTVATGTNLAQVYGWYQVLHKTVHFAVRVKFPSDYAPGTDPQQYLMIRFPSSMPLAHANLLDDSLGFVWEHLISGSYRAEGYASYGNRTYTYNNLHGAILQNSRDMFMAGNLVQINESTGAMNHVDSPNIDNAYADVSGTPNASTSHRLNANPDRVARQLIKTSCQMMFAGSYLSQ